MLYFTLLWYDFFYFLGEDFLFVGLHFTSRDFKMWKSEKNWNWAQNIIFFKETMLKDFFKKIMIILDKE